MIKSTHGHPLQSSTYKTKFSAAPKGVNIFVSSSESHKKTILLIL